MSNNVNRRQFMALTGIGAASVVTAVAAEATEVTAAEKKRPAKLSALVVHNAAGDIQSIAIVSEELEGELELVPEDGEQVLRADVTDFGFKEDPESTPLLERQGIVMEEFRVVDGRVKRR